MNLSASKLFHQHFSADTIHAQKIVTAAVSRRAVSGAAHSRTDRSSVQSCLLDSCGGGIASLLANATYPEERRQ
ncbi:hypothetical protein SRHO_G00132800 [Serrasalmus rhombeus]